MTVAEPAMLTVKHSSKPQNLKTTRVQEFSDGANRDRTGDILLAKSALDVSTRCQSPQIWRSRAARFATRCRCSP